MQCPNRACGAAVEEGVRVCPQCGTDLKALVPPGLSEDDNLGTEAPAQASHAGHVPALTNRSLILVTLLCPLFWGAVLYRLGLQHQLAELGQRFVGRFIPLSFLPFAGVAIVALLMTLPVFVLVHIAITRGRRFPGTGGVRWRSLFGALVGYLAAGLIMLMAFSAPSKAHHHWESGICANNLKQIGIVLQMYANESKGGSLPPLSPQPGVLMFSAEAIDREAIDRMDRDNLVSKDTLGNLLTCPTLRYTRHRTTGPASPFDDQSYFYLGYLVLDDNDVEAFAQAYRKKIAEGGTFEGDLVVETGKGTRVLHRLAEGVERFMLPEGVPLEQALAQTGVRAKSQSKIPIFIERDGVHLRGATVLYLDGHVSCVARGKWPNTEKTQRILADLAK